MLRSRYHRATCSGRTSPGERLCFGWSGRLSRAVLPQAVGCARFDGKLSCASSGDQEWSMVLTLSLGSMVERLGLAMIYYSSASATNAWSSEYRGLIDMGLRPNVSALPRGRGGVKCEREKSNVWLTSIRRFISCSAARSSCLSTFARQEEPAVNYWYLARGGFCRQSKRPRMLIVWTAVSCLRICQEANVSAQPHRSSWPPLDLIMPQEGIVSLNHISNVCAFLYRF